MKKVLFVAHVDSHIRHFHLPYLKYFKEKGYEVHVATSNDENELFPNCDVKHTIAIERSPFKLNNIKAISQMKQLLKENDFALVHCHTPMGSVVTRLACKEARKKGTKVLYTAHGFHFFKGAPLQNWFFYYPVEKYLSRRTDMLITINHEDYELAQKKFKASKIAMIHGVGVDDKRFNEEPLSPEIYEQYRTELQLHDDNFVMMYVAELNKNKNQSILIDAMKDLSKDYPQFKLFLIGKGEWLEYYQNKIHELQLQDYITLLGYRRDIQNLLKFADLCVASSIREGLGLNLIEAALCGVPLLAIKNRGHDEVIKEGINGFIYQTKEELKEKIVMLYQNSSLRKELSRNARESVKEFVAEKANQEQIQLYEEIL